MLVWFAAQTAPDKPELKAPPKRYHPALLERHKPVKTQFGWHVIMVEERNERYLPPLEQVSNELRQGLAQQVVQSYLQDLRNAAKITYADGMAPSPTTPVTGQ